MKRMHRLWAASSAAAILLLGALGGSGALAQSGAPSPVPSITPTGSATPQDASVVGPITWKRVSKGKDFTKAPSVYQAAQLHDGRLIVVGNTADAPGFDGRPTGAAWTSADGRTWSRLKLKAPKGSWLVTIEQGEELVVVTGIAADGTGLVWTSTDGTSWTPATPPAGTFTDMLATDDGFIAAGIEQGGATFLHSTDGMTWSADALAPKGRAMQVAKGPDGALVVAGAVGTDDQGHTAPAVWNSADGSTWTETVLPGLAPGFWSIPAMTLTPVGFVLALSEQSDGGLVGHVLVSPDGLTWTETLMLDGSSATVAGTAGGDALLIGHGQVLRSSDGLSWNQDAEPAFKDWVPRDLITLADGRLFAAGDEFQGSVGSAMAIWTGTAEEAS